MAITCLNHGTVYEKQLSFSRAFVSNNLSMYFRGLKKESPRSLIKATRTPVISVYARPQFSFPNLESTDIYSGSSNAIMKFVPSRRLISLKPINWSVLPTTLEQLNCAVDFSGYTRRYSPTFLSLTVLTIEQPFLHLTFDDEEEEHGHEDDVFFAFLKDYGKSIRHLRTFGNSWTHSHVEKFMQA